MLHIGFDRFQRAVAIDLVGEPGVLVLGIGGGGRASARQSPDAGARVLIAA
jgi:hypothetical protein